jgi:Phospholipase_D-nuclease N-terminal
MSEAAQFGTGQVFLSMLWFFLFFIWIWLLVVVFGDIFRSHDLGGWGKALWTIFVIVLPYLGVFVYLIARGGKMGERSAESAGRRAAWHASSSGVASDMAVTERRVT